MARRISCLRSQGAEFSDSDLEGVGADEFGEVGGLVGLGGAVRAHLVEVDLAAGLAAWRAASGPARPPPMTLIFFMLL